MKKILALTLCAALLLSLAACGGEQAADQPADTSNQEEAPQTPAESEGSAQDTPGSADGTAADAPDTTDPVEAPAEAQSEAEDDAFPIPANTAITWDNDSTKLKELQFSGDIVYQDLADYIQLLESMGYESNVVFWADGCYHVDIVKDNTTVSIQFTHDLPDNTFLDKVAQGEEISGPVYGAVEIRK